MSAFSETTWHDYAGEWVAVRNDAQVPPEGDTTFARWRERALDTGREFRRRLRG